MLIHTATLFSPKKIDISLTDFNIDITLTETNSIPKSLNDKATYLLFNEKNLLAIGDSTFIKKQTETPFTQLIKITPPDDIELIYFERSLQNKAIERGVLLTNMTEQMIPENINNSLVDINEAVSLILEKVGYPLSYVEPKKSKPAKSRHKWTKEVSEKEFSVDIRNSKAIVMWIKRNQMLIKKGATMMKEAPLNKDGSIGFSAKMGDKIRLDHQEQFNHFITTEDIILKSVNEVGLFLYFGGTNSWLEMIDADGKTLNEWTVVE